MLIDDLREWAGDEIALKIAAKYGGMRPIIPTEEAVKALIQLDGKIYERMLEAPIRDVQAEFCRGYAYCTKAFYREQAKRTAQP